MARDYCVVEKKTPTRYLLRFTSDSIVRFEAVLLETSFQRLKQSVLEIE